MVGVLKIFSSPWIRSRSLFSQIFHGFLFGCILRMYRPNLQSIVLAVPEIKAIAVLGYGCEPQSWGRVGRRAGGCTVRKSVGDFLYALHSNLSSIFTCFTDIASFVLQYAAFSHPTSSFPQISICFPGNRWIAFELQRPNLLGYFAISFQDFNLYDHDPPTSQTDGRI